MNQVSLENGQMVVIMITGMIGLYIGEVIAQDPTIIKVTEDGPYAELKPGDYIIQDSETRELQDDIKFDTNYFLVGKFEKKQKIYSGLSRLGVTDNTLREILPG